MTAVPAAEVASFVAVTVTAAVTAEVAVSVAAFGDFLAIGLYIIELYALVSYSVCCSDFFSHCCGC